jgi:tellurite resistance protein
MDILEKIVDVTTNTEQIIERKENKAEKESREKYQLIADTKEAEDKAKSIAKVALLNKLGIRAEEAALLLS